MKKQFVSLKLSVAILAALGANIALGANSACPGSAQGSTLASFGTPATGVGCWLTDQTFSNFSVTATSGQTTSTSDINGTSGTVGSTPWTVNAVFDPSTAGNWSETGSFGATFASGVGYLTNTTESFITYGSYVSPGAGKTVVIDSASLSAIGTTGNSGGVGGADTMSVTEILCIGNAACNTAANRVTLTATWGGNSSSPTYTCGIGSGVTADFSCGSASSASPITVTFTAPQTTLTVTDAYTMAVHNTTTDTLTSFTNSFQDMEAAPEPSTFALMGSALAGLGFLRLRRRKA